MKKSELKEYIKDRIRTKLSELRYAGKNAVNPAKRDPDWNTLKPDERTDIEKTLRAGGSVELEELNVTELARPAEEFTIATDFRSKAENVQTGGPISPTKLNGILDILDAMLADGNNTTTFSKIAQEYGLEMRRLYPVLAALRDAGVFTSTTTPGGDEEEIEGGYEADDEEDFEGGAEIDDTEVTDVPDFEPETEPDMGSLEKSQTTFDPVTQSATVFTVDNGDLIQSIVSLYKNSRARITELREDNGDELSAADYKRALQQSKESSIQILNKKLEELVIKIKQLEPEVQDKVLEILGFKFDSVNANKLYNIIAKKLGKSIEPTLPPEEKSDEEIIDTDDEEIMEDTGVEDVSYEPTFKDYENVYERMIKLVNYKG
jgi:hypothetical protein